MARVGNVLRLLVALMMLAVLVVVFDIPSALRDIGDGISERRARHEGRGATGEGGVTIASARANCAGADRLPERRADATFIAAVECLMVVERRHRGLGGLDRHAQLVRAAQAHTDDMVLRQFFEHETPEGESVGDRARRFGYVPRPGVTWRVGENLYYGTGHLGTPRRVVRGWMESPRHRDALLEPTFIRVGVGVAHGQPDPQQATGVVTTAVFGVR